MRLKVFFSSRRRHTIWNCDWSSDVCSSDLQLDRAAIRRDAQKLSDARGRLFERELMMLADMRGVLNESQWNRMRSGLLERLGNATPQRQKMNDRPNQR